MTNPDTTNQKYTVDIDNLSISGSAEQMLELSQVFEYAANHIEEMLFTIKYDPKYLKEKQHKYEKISRQITDVIREDSYYKQYIAACNQMTENIVNKIISENYRKE